MRTIKLTQFAYVTGTDEHYWYEAHGYDDDDREYNVEWEILDSFDPECGDEGDACDWEHPSTVTVYGYWDGDTFVNDHKLDLDKETLVILDPTEYEHKPNPRIEYLDNSRDKELLYRVVQEGVVDYEGYRYEGQKGRDVVGVRYTYIRRLPLSDLGTPAEQNGWKHVAVVYE